MFMYYNAYPKNPYAPNCFIRASCYVQNRHYEIVKNELHKLKREMGYKKVDTNVLEKYYSLLGYSLFECEKMLLSDFQKKYNAGTYLVVNVKNDRNQLPHITVVENGVIIDTWNCENQFTLMAWKVK